MLAAGQQLPPRNPPANWRAPPAAGFLDATGMRQISKEPWRPVSPLLLAWSRVLS